MLRRCLNTLLLLSLFTSPAAAGEPVRHGFQNWLAVTEADGGAYCRPRAYLFSSRKVPDFQLRVIRTAKGAGCRIALFSAFRFVDLGREVRVRVDGNPGLRIDGRVGRKDGETLQIYTVTDPAAAQTLLGRMRAGAWVRFDYTDLMGQRQSAVFSLLGVSAALDAIGCGRAGR